MFWTKTRRLAFEPMLISDHASKPQTTLNQYILTARLGRGANGTVHLAIDSETGREVAVKAIRLESSSDSAALQREIRNMRRLNHPNIVKLLKVLYRKDNRTAYLIMEYAICPLKGQRLSEAQARSAFSQLVSGLLYLHDQGMVHQDVKPSNILLFDGIVKLADFGIGHSFASAETVIGTPAYQAPEFLEEGLRSPAKEDVWSWGVTMFEVLFGRLPFNGETVYEILANAKQMALEVPTTASDEIRDLLRKMMCPGCDKRISMEEVARHPFFAREKQKVITLAKPSLKKKTSNGMVDVSADVCGDDYDFTPQESTVAGSWPRLRSQIQAF
jgi:serine/threonine-protein kinase 11